MIQITQQIDMFNIVDWVHKEKSNFYLDVVKFSISLKQIKTKLGQQENKLLILERQEKVKQTKST